MISGWQESSGIDLYVFLEEYMDAGARYVICTDISKDGVMAGPSLPLYQKIIKRFPEIKLIASGGVTSRDDLKNLRANGLFGAIIGKAFYEGKLSLADLTEY